MSKYLLENISSQCVLVQGASWQAPDGPTILSEVTLSLGRHRYGLVGRNGSGKTTLLRLIVGEVVPSVGTVSTSCRLGYLPQHIELAGARTVAAVLGVEEKLRALSELQSGVYREDLLNIIDDDWDVDGRCQSELRRLGLSHLELRRDISDVSGGELTRLALANILIQQPEFLILDEPTNNLDRESREYVYKILREWQGGALIVSHDRTLLESSEHIVELSGHRVRMYAGSFSDYEINRAVEDAAAIRVFETAQQKLRQEQLQSRRSIERQQHRASAGKVRRRQSGQAKIILGVWKESSQKTGARMQKLFERRITDAKAQMEQARARLRPQNELKLELPDPNIPAGKNLVKLEHLSFSYSEDTRLMDDFNLSIIGPERIAICGRNGSGKTTLLRLIVGELTPIEGAVRLGTSKIGYVPQSAAILVQHYSVLQNFMQISGHGDGRSRELLSRLMFFGSDVFKPVEAISGGERIRLALGAVLLREPIPDLIIVDEPTNHLDLDSIEQLESAFQDYGGALIIVSHDLRFLQAIGVEREIEIDI